MGAAAHSQPDPHEASEVGVITEQFCADLDQLSRAISREQLNPLEQDLQLIYLVGQTADNEAGVLDAVPAESSVNVGCIGYADFIVGYPGFNAWRDKLVRRGVAPSRIVAIHGSVVEDSGRQSIHTWSEAGALVRYAQQHGLDRIGIIAAPFHQLRAFISTVSWALKIYPQLNVYNLACRPLPWDEHVSHSQGTTEGKRSDILIGEVLRVIRYYLQGSLVAPAAVLSYLSRRAPPHAKA